MTTLVNEESNINHALGVTPTDSDVLMGKGTPINNHQGNKKFRHLIKLNNERYDNATEGKKYIVARDVVDFLYNEGCRFLKKTKEGVWIEVPKSRAYAKAQQTLRDGAPKRRERKHRLLQERLQAESPARTVMTPPAQMATTIPTVVSPVASPTVLLSLEASAPLTIQQEDPPQPISPSVVSLEDWISDTASVSDDELEAIILQPADPLDDDFSLFGADEENDIFCSRACVERTLLSDDSGSDDDFFDLLM